MHNTDKGQFPVYATPQVVKPTSETFTTAPLGPGEYVVTARAREHVSAHELVRAGDGTTDVVLSLARCDPIQVHWRTTDGAPILLAFDRAADAASPQLGLAVFATRETPSQFAATYETNVGSLMVNHFRPAPAASLPGRAPR